MNVTLIELAPFSPPTIPISLGYIAAFLKKKGFNTKIITISQQGEYSLTELAAVIDTLNPKLIGFSTYQRNILFVLGLARFIKDLNKEVRIALGGPQITFMPKEALKEMPMVDYLCRDEGELSFLSIAKAIASGEPFKNIRGATYRLGDEIIDRRGIRGYEDLDKYPSPYLMDIFDYNSVQELILLTSRGCPYNCLFCYTPEASKHKIRFHSIERVIEEIGWVVKNGRRHLWFADPNFSFKTERVHQLLEEIIRHRFKVKIWLETRVDLVNEPMIKKMKRAGVHTIAFGLESASEEILKTVKKQISLAQLEEAVSLAQNYGLEVELFSLFGLPGENLAQAIKTLEFAKSNHIKIHGNSNAQQMQLYFGSPLTKNYKAYGIKPFPEKRPLYLSIGDRYVTKTMSKEEIETIKALWRENSLDKGKRQVS